MEINKDMLRKVIDDLTVETGMNYSLLGSLDEQYCVYLNGTRYYHIPQVSVTSWGDIKTVYHEVQLLRRFHGLLGKPVEEEIKYSTEEEIKYSTETFLYQNPRIMNFLDSAKKSLKVRTDKTYIMSLKSIKGILVKSLYPRGLPLSSITNFMDVDGKPGTALYFKIPICKKEHKQIYLVYTERLSDNVTIDYQKLDRKALEEALGDTIILTDKDFKNFEHEILNIHNSFCGICNARLNRIDQKCPFCHETMPEDPLLIIFLSSKKIRDFREAVLDHLLSYKYITHDQMKKEANKFNLKRGQFGNILGVMFNNRDLVGPINGKYRGENKI